MILGTAGHIDHGKTALVRALTGQETDRLREEQERGISIELGFAHFDGPGGERAGVVDVPGHERFIRTMLAGAHGMDVVLLVVAADDGVMPQTEEHLDILHVLGVTRGIVVITKTDLADAASVAAVREEIEILLAGTTLEGAQIVPVSVVTGAGMDDLRREIAGQLARTPAVPSGGPFRLPVDRCFVMRGHGVVVTGTAISGSVAEGDAVRVLPAGTLARVRGLQVHGAPVIRAGARQRIAMNLAGLDRGAVVRGDVVGHSSLDRPTARLDAWVELRPGARTPIETHGRVRVHLGTAEVVGKVVLLDGRPRLERGEAAFAQVVLRRPVAALGGDRFVLRDQTARWTLGGGRVLAPFAERHRVGDAAVLAALAAIRAGGDGALTALLALSPRFGETAEGLAVAAATDPERVGRALRSAGAVDVPDGAETMFVPRERWEGFEKQVVETVRASHRREPTAPGIALEHVRSRLPWDVSPRAFRWGVERLAGAGRVVRDGELLRMPEHRVALGDTAAELGARVEEALAAAGLTPPSVAVLAEALGVDGRALQAVLDPLERSRRVVRVGSGLYFHPDAVALGKQVVEAHCREHGEITAAALRDRIGASRKFAIAFLDWCDRNGFTTRIGDVRRLRR